NALTSDSKLLVMDRSLIKEALTALGMADNTIGLLLHDRPLEGHFEYAVGIFDSVAFEKVGTTGTRQSDELMPAGRIALNLLDPMTPEDGYADYQGSYLGEGERLAIGANSAYLGDALSGLTEFDLYAWGADLFYNYGRFTFEAEYDWFTENMITANPDVQGDGWYVQGGYLLHRTICCALVELAARYQELDGNGVLFSDELQWTSLGMNIYIRQHNLKIQTDYTFKRERTVEIDNDMYQIQLQLDF
ncbi:MAG: hypothetical protein HUU20_26535, partial [Pirellulales bacterium]|nr:hypothetical protein [Pirellulales bacterium]